MIKLKINILPQLSFFNSHMLFDTIIIYYYFVFYNFELIDIKIQVWNFKTI